MSKLSGRLASLYAELKRRRVVRIAIAYGVFAAAAIQLADPILEALFLPSWTLTAVVIIAATGFPVVVVLAWMFDITRDSEDVAPATPDVDAAFADADPIVYHVTHPLAELVGRDEDLRNALELLARPECRVLTLTGPGGIGKTRLAEEISARLATQYRHGVCFIPLAGIETAESLPAAVAEALGLTLSAQQNATRQLTGFLQEKNVLLVFDNFEQIIDSASLLTDIITRAPQVKAVVTSRRRLRIGGEIVFQLDALSLPPSGELLETSAASVFFLQIARRNDPDFAPDASAREAIARICHIAGGIPLAIELAAAAIGVLTCEEIATELALSHELWVGARRDLPQRHQSLHAVFESSWRLLDANERRAFRRLSVFRSGFDGGAALVVANAELQVLAHLVEISLVQRRQQHEFEMLEVVRQFAAEKLERNDAEASETRGRHSTYHLAQLAAIAALRDVREIDQSLNRIAQHNADLRAAWLRGVADGRHEEVRAAAPALFRLLEARGRSAEGVDLFGRAVTGLRKAAHSSAEPGALAAYARLLTRYAAFLIDIGEISEAGQHLEEALGHLRAEGDRAEIAFALLKQCNIARASGDFYSPAFTECLALYRELADAPGIARALNALGGALYSRGEYEAAQRVYEESVQFFRQSGLDGEAWIALNNLAGIASVKGDWATAVRILEHELTAARKRINPRALTFLLTNLGTISNKAGDLESARKYLAESAQVAREMGYRGLLAYSLNSLAGVQLRSGNLAAAADTYRDAVTVALDAEEGPLIPTILVDMARLCAQRDDRQRAGLILNAVQAHPSCDEETRTNARSLLSELQVAAPESEVTLDAAIAAALEPERVSLSA